METIKTTPKLIKECLLDLYFDPKNKIVKWSRITNQTCQIRLAYPGQHLASLITGVKGTGTAARGDDLSDGSEVKSCSRADQLSECKDCQANVLIWMNECPECASNNIKIKTDSHWIFPIKSEDELNLLLEDVPRIVLLLFDKESNESNEIRLRAWVVDPRNAHANTFFSDYYYNNYMKKEKPAPCNLHPLQFDFFMMEPKLIFYADLVIEEMKVNIRFWDLMKPKPMEMPIALLKKEEIFSLFSKELNDGMSLSEIKRENELLPLKKMRELKMRQKITKTNTNIYSRRK